MVSQTNTVTVDAFRSRLIVVAVGTDTSRHKVFQVLFGRDGSLFVTFPYFRHQTGIAASATIPGNGLNTSNVSLQIGGKITSHLVKYSHHSDGRAHFSQTGKVRTEIKKQSVPLDSQWGHIFTVHIQGLNAFKAAEVAQPLTNSHQRATISFRIPNSLAAVKFVGRWFDVAKLPVGGTQGSVIGPGLRSQDPDGNQQNGVLVASPYANARHVLFVTCDPVAPMGSEPEMMLFYGGFDPRVVMDDVTKDANFLAFMYPASDAEALKALLGTVDL